LVGRIRKCQFLLNLNLQVLERAVRTLKMLMALGIFEKWGFFFFLQSQKMISTIHPLKLWCRCSRTRMMCLLLVLTQTNSRNGNSENEMAMTGRSSLDVLLVDGELKKPYNDVSNVARDINSCMKNVEISILSGM
jgi:hypothetical protein